LASFHHDPAALHAAMAQFGEFVQATGEPEDFVKDLHLGDE
jgi:hypothetical protein